MQFMPRLTSKNIARARGNRRDVLRAFFPKNGAKSGVSRRTARAAAQEGSRRLVLSFYNGSRASKNTFSIRTKRESRRVSFARIDFEFGIFCAKPCCGCGLEVDFLLLDRDSFLELAYRSIHFADLLHLLSLSLSLFIITISAETNC